MGKIGGFILSTEDSSSLFLSCCGVRMCNRLGAIKKLVFGIDTRVSSLLLTPYLVRFYLLLFLSFFVFSVHRWIETPPPFKQLYLTPLDRLLFFLYYRIKALVYRKK